MRSDPDVRERIHRAVDLIDSVTDEALKMVGDAVARRQHRRRVGAIAVTVAIVGSLAFAGWRATIQEAPVPADGPSPTTRPIERRIEITPPPQGVQAQLNYKRVERHVLNQIARDEAQIGTRLAEPRVLSITYVEANEPYPVKDGALVKAFPTWVVTFQGTVVVCSDWCSGHPGATIQFADDPDNSGGSSAMLEMVCVVRGVLEYDNAPKSTDKYPDC